MKSLRIVVLAIIFSLALIACTKKDVPVEASAPVEAVDAPVEELPLDDSSCDIKADLFIFNMMWTIDIGDADLEFRFDNPEEIDEGGWFDGQWVGEGEEPAHTIYRKGGKPFTGTLCTYENDADEDGELDKDGARVLHSVQVYKDGKADVTSNYITVD